MRICTGEIFDSNVVYLITPLCSVRPDQYYTDVIARPMSGIGRKPVAGRDVEVVPRNSEMHISTKIQVVAEEEQQFLSRQQQFLSQGLPPQQSGAMPTGDQHITYAKRCFTGAAEYIIFFTPYAQNLPLEVSQCLWNAGVQKTPDRKVVGSPGVQGSPKKVRVQLFHQRSIYCWLPVIQMFAS